jgi:hypothetical protein
MGDGDVLAHSPLPLHTRAVSVAAIVDPRQPSCRVDATSNLLLCAKHPAYDQR